MHPTSLTTSSNSAFSKLNSGNEKLELRNGDLTDVNSVSSEKSPSSSVHCPSKISSPPSSSSTGQKQVLKFSVDSIMSEKTPTHVQEDRDQSESPHSVSSDEGSCADSPKLSSSSMGPFSMEGILSKHHSIMRNSDSSSSSLISHVPTDGRWPGFYTAASFPWLPGATLSPPKGKSITPGAKNRTFKNSNSRNWCCSCVPRLL